MSQKSDLSKIDVLILCGGLGTRLRPLLTDRPKVLAPIGEKTFLDILIFALTNHGFRRFILCVGHLREQIIEYFNMRNDAEFLFSVEEIPLGTGGAIKNAEPLIKSDPFIVMNGDSLCSVNFNQFHRFHLDSKADLSILLTHARETKDYGNVRIDTMNRVISFQEKEPQVELNLINAGIYMMQQKCFESMPQIPKFSLEYEFFPQLLNIFRCFGFVVENELFDIGAPERYIKINQLLMTGIENVLNVGKENYKK